MAALKNLLNNLPPDFDVHQIEGSGSFDGGPLYARKWKAFEREMNAQLLTDVCTDEERGQYNHMKVQMELCIIRFISNGSKEGLSLQF